MPRSTSSPRFPVETRFLYVIAFCVFCSHQNCATKAEHPARFLSQGTQPAGSVVQNIDTDVMHNTQIVERSSTDISTQTQTFSDVRGLLKQGPGIQDLVFPAHKTTGVVRELDIRHVNLDPGILVGQERYLLEEKISVIYPGTKQHLMIKRESQVATINKSEHQCTLCAVPTPLTPIASSSLQMTKPAACFRRRACS